MTNALKAFKRNEKGFTLIELLAVIVILAVIALIAYPLIGNIINKSKDSSDLATARQVYEAARLYAVEHNAGTLADVDIATLQTAGYLETPLYLPSSKAPISGGSFDADATGASAFITLTTGSGGSAVNKTYTKDEIMTSTKATP